MASNIYIAVTIIYIIIKYIRDIILLKYITKRGYKFSNPYKQINKFLMNLLILFIPFIRTIFITKKIIVLFNLNKYINIISNKIVLLSEKEKVKVKNNFSLFCILKINFSNEIMANSLIVYMENNEENGIIIEEMLKKLREDKNWSYNDVSYHLNDTNIMPENIKKMESGLEYPDLDMMYKLSELYSVPVEDLVKAKEFSYETLRSSFSVTLIKWINYFFGISFKISMVLVTIFYFVAAIRKLAIFYS